MRGYKQRWPLPPSHDFRHGDIWLVTAHPVEHRRMKSTAAAVLAAPPTEHDYYVLLTQPWTTWPRAPYRYYRSRLVVGDTQLRGEEAIAQDFRKLILQTPPVQRNWSSNLTHYSTRGQTYMLIWREVVSNARG